MEERRTSLWGNPGEKAAPETRGPQWGYGALPTTEPGPSLPRCQCGTRASGDHAQGGPRRAGPSPRLRFPGRRAASHHARQAPALPGTRGRLLQEILPVWLQHRLLGERWVGSGPCAGDARRRGLRPLLGGDRALPQGLGTVSPLFPPTPTSTPTPRTTRRNCVEAWIAGGGSQPLRYWAGRGSLPGSS